MKTLSIFYQVEGRDPEGCQPHYWHPFADTGAKTLKGGLAQLKRVKKVHADDRYKFRLIEMKTSVVK